MKRLLVLFLLAQIAAAPGRAQELQAIHSQPIVSQHDFDSATATYCALSQPKKLDVRVKTTGSSATLDAASGNPFTMGANPLKVAAGDEITVRTAFNTYVTRYILSVTSTTVAVMGSAADFSGNGATGYEATYRTLSCGTGANDGWFNVSAHTSKNIVFQVDQLSLASGSLAVTVQCKTSSPWAQPIPVYPPVGYTGQCGTGLFTTAGATARCVVTLDAYTSLNLTSCRLGVTLTDDGGDTGANLEQVTATLEGR